MLHFSHFLQVQLRLALSQFLDTFGGIKHICCAHQLYIECFVTKYGILIYLFYHFLVGKDCTARLGLSQGTFICVGWQVTVCDLIWQVMLCSSE